jgi:25S rRNA (uracil2634-N3)-methyltransferase
VFFKQCLKFLNNSGIAIVTHKTINPFGLWNIPKIGEDNGFKLIKQIDFDIDAYPGYQNRRGAGKCGGKMFPSEDAMTYVFERKDKCQN